MVEREEKVDVLPDPGTYAVHVGVGLCEFPV